MTFIILPFVTFPICRVYLPKRLNARAPNDPTTPVRDIHINDVANAVPEDAAPATPNKQLAPKQTFEIGFGEQ